MRGLALVIPAVLAACGDAGGGGPAPAAPTARTEAETQALLTSLPAPYDAADLDNGRRVFARCRACHSLVEGGPHMTGPNLHGVFGRQAGSAPRYAYSRALQQAGFAWDAARLDHWLENPRTFLPGNKMSFPGIADAADRRDVIAYLKVETGYAPRPVS